MITAYFLIAAFLGGWLAGAAYKAGDTFTFWSAIGTVALCIIWPFTAYILFKMWREGKL